MNPAFVHISVRDTEMWLLAIDDTGLAEPLEGTGPIGLPTSWREALAAHYAKQGTGGGPSK